MPAKMNEINYQLPDPFVFNDGKKVRHIEDWANRKKEIYEIIINTLYGGMPPVPSCTKFEILHTSKIIWMDGINFTTCRIFPEGNPYFSFIMYMYVPHGKGPFPVVINGDGCWRYMTDQVINEVIKRGMILAQFNRVEIAPDNHSSQRDSGIYRLYPGGEYGALSAWAWGYHRLVDVLSEMQIADASRIGIVGHSRGGKTVLLAGATDERIYFTAANCSGSGGAGSFKYQGEGSETIADSVQVFPYWYSPILKNFAGKQDLLPFDQHYLKALIAPRFLLTTEALDDIWANPSGTLQTHFAAREVYKFLGVEKCINIKFREGHHEHGFADWCAFLDCMECSINGKNQISGFNTDPFPELPKAFSWSYPEK